LLVAALKGGVDPAELGRAWPRRREIPFDPGARLMATFHEGPGGARVVFVKGAPGVVLERAALRHTAAGPAALNDADRAALLERNRELASRGLRILAVAWHADGWVEPLTGLTLLGLVALADPVRPEAPEAIARCQHAGIRTIMLTGDQRHTAEAVGRDLGLPPDAIHSRVSPEGKLRLVQALQRQGEIVAMTGDGVMNCRSDRLGWWRLPTNRIVWLSLAALVGLQWLAVSWPPLTGLLSTAPLAAGDWGVIILATLWPVIVMEVAKNRFHRLAPSLQGGRG
jgi:magnesium-transporting ATPase (P-type)